MTHGKAAMITLAVVVVIAAYLGLTFVLGIKQYWVGFVFLSQWGLMEQCRTDRLPHSIGGAVAGTLIAFTPSQLPLLLGATPGLVVMLAIMLWAIYAIVIGWLPLLINPAAMIFLTVITIPEIVAGAAPLAIMEGLAAGVIFFGGIGLIGTAIARRGGAVPPAEPAPAAE
jgi:hypothetical protein